MSDLPKPHDGMSNEERGRLLMWYVEARSPVREWDFSGSDLQRAMLSEADLRTADLRKVNLGDAVLAKADLRGANLRGARLEGADLRGADLRGTMLEEASLRGADFRDAQLEDADLHQADLCDADLHGVDLKDARLDGALLQRANLRGATLERARLQGADFHAALTDGETSWPPGMTAPATAHVIGQNIDLRGADLEGLNLRSARLGGADLRGARLKSACLESADLRGACLEGLDLSATVLSGALMIESQLRFARLAGADLRSADLRRARLEGADLRDTDLRGADLRGACLDKADHTMANLRGARIDSATFRASGWTGETLTGLVAQGVEVEEIDTFPLAVVDQFGEPQLGLTLRLKEPLSPLQRTMLDLAKFHFLGKATTVFVARYEHEEDRVALRFEGERVGALEALGQHLFNVSWHSAERDGFHLSELGKVPDFTQALDEIRSQIERMELWWRDVELSGNRSDPDEARSLAKIRVWDRTMFGKRPASRSASPAAVALRVPDGVRPAAAGNWSGGISTVEVEFDEVDTQTTQREAVDGE